MTVMKVNIKWGKEKYSDVELDTDADPETFKAQIFALTGVEIDRQKLLFKGKTVKDSWQGFKLKEGCNFLLMGTVGELPTEPVEQQRFVEDMTEDDKIVASDLPVGLQNLGNTCYMNSTVQCLRSVPALRSSLESFSPAGQSNTQLVSALGRLNSALTSKQDNMQIQASTAAVLIALRAQNPRFAEQTQGHFAQQDASECWSEIVRTIDQNVQIDGQSVIDRLFTIRMAETLRNTEAAEEEAVESTNKQLQLSCHIDKDVSFMLAGLERGMSEEITKMSPVLGRDAIYHKTARLARLPSFLIVNFVRFYFKRSAGENCKIRKEVKFPFEFDAFSLCTPELQEKLQPSRKLFDGFRDYEAEQQTSDVGKKAKVDAAASSQPAEDVEYFPTEFEDDAGSNNSGHYELRAVLTHKGRSAQSGHYVAWVKQDNGKWVLFDDDTVTEKKPEDILALSGSGGADWHTAYILVYGPKACPKFPQEQAVEATMDTNAD